MPHGLAAVQCAIRCNLLGWHGSSSCTLIQIVFADLLACIETSAEGSCTSADLYSMRHSQQLACDLT
jgi:hypothetical protein